jgi:hypothetical protein
MTRDDGIVRQTNVFKEMTFFNIDAAHGLTDQSLTTYYNSFYFDSSAGEGVPVYIVDCNRSVNVLTLTISHRQSLQLEPMLHPKLVGCLLHQTQLRVTRGATRIMVPACSVKLQVTRWV